MAGLITRESIDKVRQAVDLKSVVEEYVTLRTAGVGSFKGLCPFHDERTPSFHIRPAVGTYHCFGCEASGDVFAFLMGLEHTSFVETVEQLAAKAGISLEYEEGEGPERRQEIGQRQRLLEANKIADEYFQKNLDSPLAATGQQFLTDKGFTPADARHFGVGFAPEGWSNLLNHLRSQGFQDEELRATGLFSEGNRGLYDRFRGRLTWPIRDMTGATIGFGARRLSNEDKGPKYLNTPETSLYKKSQVLYGLDLAKRDVAKSRQLVVVEGYTDVMAAHIAGITTAVATCGTAFGSGHARIVRRLIADDGTGGEIIFTFDGDEAGQKAALRAFEEDQQFLAQTYVAVEPEGRDPNDLLQTKGPQAVVDLINSRRPLFEFAIQTGLKNFDLNTVEGRSGALRHAAPIVADIRDSIVRSGYVRELAGWLGMSQEDVQSAVQQARKRQPTPARNQDQHQESTQAAQQGTQSVRINYQDPVARMEREALEIVLQLPMLLSQEQWLAFNNSQFKVPAHAVIHSAVRAVGSVAQDTSNWVERITHEVPEPLESLVAELAVRPLPASNEQELVMYARDIMNRLLELQITEQKSELMGRLQRLNVEEEPDQFRAINEKLVELEQQRRSLRVAD